MSIGAHQQQQQQAASHIPAALSPSSWARAVPIGYPYGSNSYLTPSLSLGSSLNTPPQGRYSDPLSLRGHSILFRVLVCLNVFLWLVRDASLGSFALYTLFVNGLAYFLIVRGEPFSIAVVVESATSVTAKMNAAAAASGTPVVSSSPVMAPMQPMQHPGPMSLPLVRPVSLASPSSASSSSSSSSSFKNSSSVNHSPPFPYANSSSMAVAAAGASSSSSSAAAASVSSPAASPTPLTPKFHEQDSQRNLQVALGAAATGSGAEAAGVMSPAAASNGAVAPLPTIDPSIMPQTPSVEPLITPMPSVSSASGSNGTMVPTTSAASLRLPTESTPVVIAGATSRHSTTDSAMCWDRASGASYDVRVGPNYKKYGKKASSKAAMFECVGCDVFGAPEGKLDHVAQHLQLPWIAKGQHDAPGADGEDAASSSSSSSSGAESGELSHLIAAAPVDPPPDDVSPPDVMDPVTKAWDHYEVDPRVLALDEELGVPTLFIINFQIPTYAPGYFSSKEDGEGFSILLYFQITAATRAEIRSGKICGAVQLFRDFVANAHEFEYHSRFKCIPRIVNPSAANVGMAARSAMRMYNSKPFLTGPHCHQFLRGPGYMEADIDVHRFCLTARKGAHGFLDALNSLIVDVGFVVEGGRDGVDEELPEQILACSHIAHLDPMHAKSLAYYIEYGKQERAKRLAAK